jgi:heme/copper-type cytochrome/quinol oxidase subunit 3
MGFQGLIYMYIVSALIGRQAIDSTVAYLPTKQIHHLVTCCLETTLLLTSGGEFSAGALVYAKSVH